MDIKLIVNAFNCCISNKNEDKIEEKDLKCLIQTYIPGNFIPFKTRCPRYFS
jgi:hypothetical protein